MGYTKVKMSLEKYICSTLPLYAAEHRKLILDMMMTYDTYQITLS